jgi:DNA-directed RNA polymerase sigma subunit (sigma70/sigma32)
MAPTFIWPAEDGWPYPDTGADVIDLDADVDDDLLTLRSPSSHLFDDLEPLERRVITSVYGLGGQPVRSFRQLHDELGVPDADLRSALGSGLGKLRTQLA